MRRCGITYSRGQGGATNEDYVGFGGFAMAGLTAIAWWCIGCACWVLRRFGGIESPVRITERVLPSKDVDGVHPDNMGRLVLGEPANRPCTPKAVCR